MSRRCRAPRNAPDTRRQASIDCEPRAMLGSRAARRPVTGCGADPSG
ncbi:Hypothetical protein A7982_06880 [Minicystis rosea]|nr:Hypothetical protein A7982_06880 [Minicystis rosea]